MKNWARTVSNMLTFNRLTLHQRVIWMLIGCGLLSIITFAWPHFGLVGANRPPLGAQRLPEAFAGNRMAYGFALFSMFTMASLSARKVFLLMSSIAGDRYLVAPAVTFYRASLCALFATVFFGVGPDVILMLIYGDVNAHTFETWLSIDRFADGAVLFLFLIAVWAFRQADRISRVDNDKLIPRPFYEILPPDANNGQHLRLMALIALVALGLAVWK